MHRKVSHRIKGPKPKIGAKFHSIAVVIGPRSSRVLRPQLVAVHLLLLVLRPYSQRVLAPHIGLTSKVLEDLPRTNPGLPRTTGTTGTTEDYRGLPRTTEDY